MGGEGAAVAEGEGRLRGDVGEAGGEGKVK